MFLVEVQHTSEVSWVQYWRVPLYIFWPGGFVVSFLFSHKPGWTFLFLKPYIFLRKEMYHCILLIVPCSLWHSLTECCQSLQIFVPELVQSCQRCQSLFTPTSQFAISNLIGQRNTRFRGLFWKRKTWKLCGEVPIQLRFFPSPMPILPTNNSMLESDTSMWPKRVHRTASLS